MNTIEIENRLVELNRELERVNEANELTACILCNTDTNQEAIEAIQQDIEYCENQLKEIYESEQCEDDGMDYDALCYSQGISRYC